MRFLAHVLSLALSAATYASEGSGETPNAAAAAARPSTSLAPTTVGGVGLLHLSSADLGSRGILRFSVIGEYFRSSDFPAPTAANTRSAGDFAVSYVPVDFLEVYLAYLVVANRNSNSMPQRIQSLGDFTGGLKLSHRWAPGVYAGAEGRLNLFTRFGDANTENYRYAIEPKILFTYDFRDTLDFPLRLHANLGASFDDTHDLAGSPLYGPAEQYALNLNRYNRLLAAAGLEVPLPVITPFAEYSLGYPVHVTGGVFTGLDGSNIGTGRAYPEVATFGLRVQPIKNLSLTAAVDVGLRKTVVFGIPATPPYNLFLGAAYAVDTLQSAPPVVECRPVVSEVKEAPTTGRISGKVVDLATRKPISGALITVLGTTLPPVGTDPETGRFLTYELPAGTPTLQVNKDGYQGVQRPVIIQKGQVSEVQIELEVQARKTRFLISVTSNKVLVSAKVSVAGPVSREVSTSQESTMVEVPAGKYTLNVTAEGYLAQTREVEIPEGAEQSISFDLVPEPKERAVNVKGNKIEIVQKIHFASGQATILPDSYTVLMQILDAIVRNDIKRIRIEGHTDSRGNKVRNLQLSEQRARAVGDYLERSGIDPGRIETKGYGDSRPVVPNVTARGRELNRRVEIYILDNPPTKPPTQ